MTQDKQLAEVMALVFAWQRATAAANYASRTNAADVMERFREVVAARTALESRLRELLPGWRPIESAPKEGQRVLLTGKGYQGTEWVCEGWHDAHRGSWWEANVDDSDTHGMAIYPTHWQPLPPPPKEGS
jgi:hypothetical protein